MSESLVTSERLCSANERAWRAAAEQAQGPWSRLAGSGITTESFCGGIKALESQCKIDVSALAPGDLGRIYEAKDSEGRIWYCRWIGSPFWVAFRERSNDEVVEEIEATEDSLRLMIRKASYMAARRLSLELILTAGELRPERQLPRSHRRALKRRLLELSNLNLDLLTLDMSGREVRERCRAQGINAREIDYQKQLDEWYA